MSRMRSSVAAMAMAITGGALVGGAVAHASSSTIGTGCRSYSAVGISTAAVLLPARRTQYNYIATVIADDVLGQPYPQAPNIGPGSFGFSNMMNPARYNNNDGAGGAIDVWTTLDHVPAGAPSATITGSAVNPGGVVRLSIVACPIGSSGSH